MNTPTRLCRKRGLRASFPPEPEGWKVTCAEKTLVQTAGRPRGPLPLGHAGSQRLHTLLKTRGGTEPDLTPQTVPRAPPDVARALCQVKLSAAQLVFAGEII